MAVEIFDDFGKPCGGIETLSSTTNFRLMHRIRVALEEVVVCSWSGLVERNNFVPRPRGRTYAVRRFGCRMILCAELGADQEGEYNESCPEDLASYDPLRAELGAVQEQSNGTGRKSSPFPASESNTEFIHRVCRCPVCNWRPSRRPTVYWKAHLIDRG
jgi:hypothetical protein